MKPSSARYLVRVQAFIEFAGVLLDVSDVVELQRKVHDRIFSRTYPVCPVRPTKTPGIEQWPVLAFPGLPDIASE